MLVSRRFMYPSGAERVGFQAVYVPVRSRTCWFPGFHGLLTSVKVSSHTEHTLPPAIGWSGSQENV